MINVLDKISNFFKEIGKSFIIFFLYLMMSVFLSSLFQNVVKNSNFWISNLSALLVEAIILFVLFIIYHKKIIDDFKSFKQDFKSIMNTSLKNWVVGLIIMIVSNFIISMIVGNIAGNEEANRNLLVSMPLYAVSAMIFIAPITEEIIFRLSPRKAFTKKIPYALYSAIFFASMHILASNTLIELLFAIPYGALGFAFAKTFYETDNICSSISIHMIHNSVAVALAYIGILG